MKKANKISNLIIQYNVYKIRNQLISNTNHFRAHSTDRF